MEILISVLAGIGVMAVLVAGLVSYHWVTNVNETSNGFEEWLKSHDERLDKVWERFYKADGRAEDLEERIEGLEALMSEQIMDKIKKK